MCDPVVKELLQQHVSINPSPSMPKSNAAPFNSPTAIASPVPMHFSPSFLPGSSGAGSGAFSVPGRQKDRLSQSDGISCSRFDATVPNSTSAAQQRPPASGASPSAILSRDAETQIQNLQSKLSEERVARLASNAVVDDLHRQLQARDAVVDELHKQLQHLEQQLFSVMSTMERSAEDALHVERSMRSRSESIDGKQRVSAQQLQQLQLSQPRQEASPSRHASSNGSAFAPSSGGGIPTLRSPALPSNQPAQASEFDSHSTTFIKVNAAIAWMPRCSSHIWFLFIENQWPIPRSVSSCCYYFVAFFARLVLRLTRRCSLGRYLRTL